MNKRNVLQHNKAIYEKPVGNIILSREKLKSCFLKSGVIQWCQFSPLLVNKLFEFLFREVRQKKEIEGI
jgi:hypothetical protein